MMFGTMLAVVYAVPRHEAWTVCANTTCRPKPITRASMVMAPISTGGPAYPPAPLPSTPPLGHGQCSLPAGSGRGRGS